jgi:hypothetical protein
MSAISSGLKALGLPSAQHDSSTHGVGKHAVEGLAAMQYNSMS